MPGDITVQVQVQELDTFAVSTNIYNPPTIPQLADVGDVDTSTLVNGSVLVYKTTNSKWISTTTLDLQNMEGGEY